METWYKISWQLPWKLIAKNENLKVIFLYGRSVTPPSTKELLFLEKTVEKQNEPPRKLHHMSDIIGHNHKQVIDVSIVNTYMY